MDLFRSVGEKKKKSFWNPLKNISLFIMFISISYESVKV